jgi:transposase
LRLLGKWRADMEGRRVMLRVEVCRVTEWAHPETRLAASLHKWTERSWRHLDACQFETVIKARVSSINHADGSIEEVALPWAERYQRVTRLMAQAVIIWEQACGNVRKVADLMRLDWHTVDAIMKAAVERGLERRETEVVRNPGIDEKSTDA